MLPIPSHIARACSSLLLIAVAVGCGGGSDATPSTNSNVVATAGTDGAATDVTVAGSAPTVTVPTTEVAASSVAEPGSTEVPTEVPTADPCDLLTSAIASEALGVPVADKITQPGEGNTTCGYRPADPAAQGFVSLTLYGVTGTEAVLDAAATQFPDAESVDGIGDAARLSMQSQAIGVLTGSTVFALGLFPQQANGQLVPITRDQLIALANAVLAGR